jgi:hypothetical protein
VKFGFTTISTDSAFHCRVNPPPLTNLRSNMPSASCDLAFRFHLFIRSVSHWGSSTL